MQPEKIKKTSGRVSLKGSTIVIAISDNFISFVETILNTFPNELPKSYRVNYKLSDGRLFTVKSQEDYKTALNSMSDIHFFITEAYSEYDSERLKGEKCFACKGKGADETGQLCKMCNATGELNSFINWMKNDIKGAIYKEIPQMIQNELKMSSISENFIQKSFIESSSFMNQSDVVLYCATCKGEVGVDKRAFSCTVCPNFYFCELCEDEHPHPLIRIRRNKLYQMDLINETEVKKTDSIIVKTWVVKNIGVHNWSNTVRLVHVDGDNIAANVSPIEELAPGKQCEITMTIKQPAKNFKAAFQLEANGKTFGKKMMMEVKDEVMKTEDVKVIREKVEAFRATARFSKTYVESIVAVLSTGNWDLLEVLRYLINNGNNKESALAHFKRT